MVATVQNIVKDHKGRRPVPSPPQSGAFLQKAKPQAWNGEMQDKGPLSHYMLTEPGALPGTSHPKTFFYQNFKKELRPILRDFSNPSLLFYLPHSGCTLNY